MHIVEKWGANYLVIPRVKLKEYFENLKPDKIIFTNGLFITPGDRISKLGTKNRTSFSMSPEYYLRYSGTVLFEGILHAVFDCNFPDTSEKDEIQYRFVFTIVGKVNDCRCFLIHNKNACRDVVVDKIFLYEEPS